MKELKFYHCPICGNIILMIEDSGAIPHCCGEEMKILESRTKDFLGEKHVPVISSTDCGTHIEVGKIRHPMNDDHYIKWIALLTTNGIYAKYLRPDDLPMKDFRLNNSDRILKVYAYCNLHGLWEKDIAAEVEFL